jgi:hypothetical protein
MKMRQIREYIRNASDNYGNMVTIVDHIRDQDDKPIILNAMETAVVNDVQQQISASQSCQQIKNALGYEISITTLTAIIKRITTQKFATIPFADYMPVVVGEGAWMQSMIKYRTYSVSDNFEMGIVNTGANNSSFARADTGIDAVNIKIKNWGFTLDYSLFDLYQAAASGNWDIVEAKERARKTAWDLGIQRTSFLGMESDSDIKGLLTLSDVNSNTSLIAKYINAMNTTEFATFTQGVIDAYRSNNNFTAYPTHFIIPELDYNGLIAPVSEDFPVIDKLTYLTNAFKVAAQNPNFKILPDFYGDKTNNATVSGLNKNRYVLHRYDQDSFSMNIPVDYTATQQNSLNNFQWQNVGYGQFTGVNTYRPAELLYFDFS